ncbi:MAG: pilus assembly protein TadG-related protein [Candidatus Brocadiaceae bacterium]|jgi:hypothetical protein
MTRIEPDGTRDGQIVILAPVVVIILGLLLALTVDVGQIVFSRSRLQNAADSAALAAAHVLFNQRLAGEDEAAAREAALAEADRLCEANWSAAGFTVAFGILDTQGDFVEVDTGTPATAVQATSFRNDDAPGGQLPLFFGPLMGINACEVNASAVTQITFNIWGITKGLRPFAVPRSRVPGIGLEMVFYPADSDGYDDGLGQDTVVPGCWGLLNLDGGDLGSDELKEWIANGYDAPWRVDPDTGNIWVPGTSGFRATLDKPMNGAIGETFVMILYDDAIGEGSNGTFLCTGFLRATITGCKLVGNDPYISCRIAEIESLHDVLGGNGPGSPNICKVQLVQ